MNVYAYCPNCKGFVAGHVDPTEIWKASQVAAGLQLEECENRKIGRKCVCGDDVVIYRLRAKIAKEDQCIAALEAEIIALKAEIVKLETKIANIIVELNKD